MRLRWTTTASDDFVHVVERIRTDNPEAEHRVARIIYEAIDLLRTFPNRGRVGRAKNTRELVFPPWPYIVVYEINPEIRDRFVMASGEKTGVPGLRNCPDVWYRCFRGAKHRHRGAIPGRKPAGGDSSRPRRPDG